MVDGFTLMMLVFIGLIILVPIMYFGALWYSHVIYVLDIKELNRRDWFERMGLCETALMKQKRFLK